MPKIILDKPFLELFPNARVGVVYAKGIDNKITEEAKYKHLIEKAQEETLAKNITKDVFIENEVVKVWREAYQQFKTKKGARCAIENLLKRVKNDNPVGSINPVVDLYNYISIKYAFPVGGDDHNKVSGDTIFTVANGTESFTAIGADQEEKPHEGEVILADGAGAICRCWNWRQTQRTMIDEDTTEATFLIEYCNKDRIEDQDLATKELAELLEKELGAIVTTGVVDIENPEFELK